MERAEDFKRRAAEAEEVARRATDPLIKQEWTEVAEQWRTMARQAEQLAKRT